jgi:hypothetical protein
MQGLHRWGSERPSSEEVLPIYSSVSTYIFLSFHLLPASTIVLMDWPRDDVEERIKRRKALAGVIDRLPSIATLTIPYWASAPWGENCDPHDMETDVPSPRNVLSMAGPESSLVPTRDIRDTSSTEEPHSTYTYPTPSRLQPGLNALPWCKERKA